MTNIEEIGKIEKIHIQWKIDDYISVVENKIYNELFSYNFNSPSFSTAYNNLWSLNLWPNWDKKYTTINLFLESNEEREYPIEYFIGLKKHDGSVQQLVSGILDGDKTRTGILSLITTEELLQRQSELLPCNVLTIICILKLKSGDSYPSQETLFDTANPVNLMIDQNLAQQTISHKAKPLKLIKLDKLSEDFKDLYADKDTCDVILKVKDKEYKAHKTVLMARSSVFTATFKHDTLEKQTGIVTISDCDPDSFQEFLEYLYCGKLEGLSFRSALNLYYSSDKYDVEELKAFCIEYLIQCLTTENICEIAVFADMYDETALLSAVQKFFNKNVTDILITSEWERLMKKHFNLANKLLIEMSKVKHKN